MTVPTPAKAGVLGLMAMLVVAMGTTQPGLAQNPAVTLAQGESGSIELITAPQLSATAVPTADPLSVARRERRVPLGIPVSREEFADLKHDAAANPDPAVMAQWADDIEEFAGPEPLGHTVNVTFVGLDRFTAQSAGTFWYPPDTIVAAGTTRVLEATNSGARVSTTAGGVLSTMDLNAFFSASSATYGFLFDPKVYYDRLGATPRFFLVALSRCCSPFTTTRTSRIWFAVSRSNSPASLASAQWCRYSIDARRNAGTVNDSWGDYPGIGFGSDGFVISVNNFTWGTSSFTFSIVRALRKLALENNAAGCPAGSAAALKVFQASTVLNDGAAFTVQPVQHYTAPSSFAGVTNPIYLIATQYGISTSIRLWRIANVAGTAAIAGPFLMPGGLAFGIPPLSPQLGTGILLDTGDNRITQAAGLANALHGVFATNCNIGGGNVESCIRYVRLLVSGPTLSAVYQQQLTFGGTNVFYWWPGAAVNLMGKVMLVYQRGSVTTYLSAGYTGKPAAATTFEPNTMLTTGTCSETGYGSPGRTGDYVGVQTDPVGTAFWLAGERMTALASMSGTCQWQTWIRKVTPP